MREDATSLYYEATFREANGGLSIFWSIVAAGVALALAAAGEMTGAFFAIAAGGITAQIARSNMRWADALYARAVAAELAEGGDAIEYAEAA